MSTVIEIENELLAKWLYLKVHKNTLKPFFDSCGIYSATLIGDSKLNDILIEDLRELGIFVEKENLKNPKLVIITDIENFYSLKKKVQAECDISVVSIRELIHLSYMHYFTIPDVLSNKRVYWFRYPLLRDYDNLSLYESAICKVFYTVDEARSNPPSFSFLYKNVPEYSNEYIMNVFMPQHMISVEGVVKHADLQSTHVNITNGERFTTDAPESYEAIIHLFGNCMQFGCGMDDSRTIGSCMQRILNDNGKSYKVINYGVGNING